LTSLLNLPDQPSVSAPGFSANGATGGRPLRVCHLGKFYAPASGGIETHLQTLAQAQARLGLAVEVLCVNHMDHERRDVTWKALARTRTLVEEDGAVRLRRVGRWASFARLDLCFGLGRRLRSLGPDEFDLLHLHVPNPTMILALYFSRPKLPVVITYHSDVIRQKALLFLQRPFENWVFRRAGGILATSPEYPRGSDYLRRFGDKTTVVPFGIDLDAYLNPSPEAMHCAEEVRQYGQPLWLAVGRLVYYKGLDNAIRALAHVPGRLMIVGDGPLKANLEALAREVGVAERVIWRGRLGPTELVGAYHAATALWFPSVARSEAFGFVQIEAMACGCPVINTAIAGSGVPWVSRDGESGITIPVGDWQALAQAANRLWSDADLRHRLGQQARERACREFDADLMARRTVEVYHHALNLAPRDSPLPRYSGGEGRG
jgi:glycosyltransferase involved in cell wall biosynthesis